MENLLNEIHSCKKCPLSSLMPLGRCVGGVGNLKSKIVLVGEALGYDESLLEEPFVGLCGKFLNKILEKVSIQRDEIWITNTVKGRPFEGKKNRPPNEKEINACVPYLFRELEIIRPTVIVSLGNIPTYVFLRRKTPMKDLIGQSFETEYGLLVPCYHPSYLMGRGKKQVEIGIQTLKMAKELSEGENGKT